MTLTIPTLRLGRPMALALALSSTAVAAIATAEEPMRGGTLRMATANLDTSDPHRHVGSIGLQQVYVETLTSIADDGSVIPFLAESFDVSDDGLEYTFRIRDGVRFHNGREMTAEDVLANFARVRDEVEGGWLASAMRYVQDMEVSDANTFIVRLEAPYAPFLALISELWIVAPESDGWDGTIVTPIGTGPFTFGDWVPQVTFTGYRHDEYWREGMPYVDAIEFDVRLEPDYSLALRAGDLHIARIPTDRISVIENDPALSLREFKDTSWYFLSFNNRDPRPPFDNPRVREAVSWALDKAALMDFVAPGRGIVTNQMTAPGNFYHDDALHDRDQHVVRDLDRAREILAEEGVDPAERPLLAVSWQHDWIQVALQMVAELGFEIEHIALDDVGAQQRLRTYDWDLAPFSSGPRADIFLRYVRMMSDGPNVGLWGGVQDPEFDRIVEDAIATVDDDERRDLYLQAWDRVMEHYYTVVIGHQAGVLGVREEVQGFDAGFTWSPNRADGGVAYVWLSNVGQ